MHIVPAPAESLMKSRVLSIPGLQGVMDKGSAAFQTFRGSVERGGGGSARRHTPYPPPTLPSKETSMPGRVEDPPRPGISFLWGEWNGGGRVGRARTSSVHFSPSPVDWLVSRTVPASFAGRDQPIDQSTDMRWGEK